MKAFLFSVGCVFAWVVLFPIMLIGGGMALFLYAAAAELGRSLIGLNEPRIDASTANKIARQICVYPQRLAGF